MPFENNYTINNGTKNSVVNTLNIKPVIPMSFGANWSARGVVSYTQLLGDASNDSPVVDEGSEGQLFSAVMAMYNF